MKVFGLLLLTACGSTDAIETVGYVPVSAVIIRAEGALGGKACGTGTDAVFKYRVTAEVPAAIQGKTEDYDCFVDAYLIPPETTAAEQAVEVTVRGFSKAQWEVGATSPQMVRTCKGIKKPGVQTVLTCTASQ
jgi:hypothetical protein